jgi:hypothetical protein
MMAQRHHINRNQKNHINSNQKSNNRTKIIKGNNLL